MKIKIINRSSHPLPTYQTEASAGMDLIASIDNPIILQSLERTMVSTGLYIELPTGYEAQIRPRSGLAFKKGLSLINSPGTIDADYRGEIGVLLVNLSKESVTISNGDRIAQMVIARHERIDWVEVSEISDTNRGSGGFGSTGHR